MSENRAVDMLITVVARFGGKSINLLVFVIVARALSLTEVGIYGFIFSLTLILSTVLDIGVRNSLAVFLGQDAKSLGSMSFNAFILWACLSVACFPAVYVSFATSSFDIVVPAFLIPSSVLLISMLYLRVMQGALLGSGDIALYNRTELASRIALIALTALFLVAGKFSLNTALWALALSQAAAAFYLFVYQRRAIFSGAALDPDLIRRLLRRGFVFMLSVLLMSAAKRLAFLAVGHFSSPENAGLFFGLQRLTEVITEVGMAVAVVIFSYNVRAQSTEEATRATAQSTRICFAVLTLISLGFAVTEQWSVPLALGQKYAGHSSLFLIILMATLAGAIWTMLFPSLSVSTSPMTVFWLLLPGLALNVAIISPMIQMSGLNGAAWSMLVANIVLTASFLLIYKKRFGIPLRDFLLPKKSDFQGLRKLKRKAA